MDISKNSTTTWKTGGVQDKRNSNLELYRIIVMLLIIAHHYVVNSGLTLADGPILNDMLSTKSIFLCLFGAWGKTGINCFVLITGYFMCQSKITPRKFFKLLFEIYYYRIIIGCIFLATGYTELSLIIIAKMILPFTSLSTGFSGCFLVFYLTIPFLTILVNHLNEKMHLRLLLLIFLFYVVFASIPKMVIGYSYVSWFMCLFFIASYIRKYPKKLFENTKFWGWASFFMLVVSSLSIIGFVWIGTKTGNSNIGTFWLSDSNRILAVITSITWFMFFKNIKINQSRVINALGGATFGVLLIHANSDAMRQWLWKDILDNVGMYDNGKWIYLHSIASVFAIFIICAVIDILRQKFIEKPFFKLWDRFWDKVTIWYSSKERII